MNGTAADVPSVAELARSMEKSVQDAAIVLQRIRNPGMSGMNRIIRQTFPDLAEEIRTWVPEKPWRFGLEMAVQVHTRTPGRLLRLLARIKNQRQKNLPENGTAASIHLTLHTGKPPFFACFFSNIRWHDLFIAVQIEQTQTGQRQTCRILSLNGSQYEI